MVLEGRSIQEEGNQSKCPNVVTALACLRKSRRPEWLEQNDFRGIVIGNGWIFLGTCLSLRN